MDLSKYQAIFNQESARYLSELEALMRELETAYADPDIWSEINGKIHSIKGMARALNMENISDLCHQVEEWCRTFQDGEIGATPETCSIVEESIDLLKLLVARRDEVESAETLQWRSRMIRRLEAGPRKTPVKENKQTDPSRARKVQIKPIDEVRVRYSLIEELLGLGQEIQMLEKSVPLLPEDETLVGIKGWVDQCMSLMKTFFFRLSQLRLMTVDDFMGLFTHAIHQLARTSEKQVRLTVSGGEIHADITLLERLREPLIHLFRNCIAHGIEPPDERTRSGKQATGEIQVTANAHRERLVLEISDDGRGIDPDPIRLFLKEKRRMSEDRIAKMTEEEIFRTILHPDYSSMTETTDIAGRGVGMSVVSQAIEHIGGSLNIHSKKNEGTRFVITMPLSLSIIYAITFKIGSFTLSIPTSEVASIRGVADITREEMERTIDLKRYLEPGGKLSTSFYHFIELKSDRTDGNGDGASPFTGLPVDAIVGNNPLMVMPIGELLSKAGIFSGVGIMENGDVSMVLDVGWLKKHV